MTLPLSGPAQGRLSAIIISHSKYFLCGAFVWARKALNNQKRWVLAWA
jgi:hypothetical protein